METIEIGGLVFHLKEIHQRAPRSWDRSRKRHRFDGWELTLPGALLRDAYATREEAVAAAKQLVAGADDLHLIRASNARAIAAGKTFYD